MIKLLMSCGLGDLLQSSTLKSLEVNVISKTMTNIFENMMIGLMKVYFWGMLQTVKDTYAIIRVYIKWLTTLTLKMMKVCLSKTFR